MTLKKCIDCGINMTPALQFIINEKCYCAFCAPKKGDENKDKKDQV